MMAAAALSRWGNGEALAYLREMVQSDDPDVAKIAAVPTRVDDTRFRRASLPDGLALPDEAQLVRNSRRMIDVAAYELSQVRAGNVPNTPPPAPAPPPSTGSGTPRVKPAPTHAPNDTTHVKRPPMPRGGKPGGKPRPGTPADTTRG